MEISKKIFFLSSDHYFGEFRAFFGLDYGILVTFSNFFEFRPRKCEINELIRRRTEA